MMGMAVRCLAVMTSEKYLRRCGGNRRMWVVKNAVGSVDGDGSYSGGRSRYERTEDNVEPPGDIVNGKQVMV